MKKAILIDVVAKTVTETEIGEYTDIYSKIGNGCSCFCCPVDFDNGDTLYSDDEGLLHDEVFGCFVFDGWDYPLVGNAIILGTDEKGESVDCKSTVNEITSRITFYNQTFAEAWKEKALSSGPTIYFN